MSAHGSWTHVSRARRQRVASTITFVVLCLVLVAVVTPGLWTISTSLKTTSAISAYPPRWIPEPVYVHNYVDVLTGSHIIKYLMNSLFVTCLTVVVTVALAAHVAYAASRFRFWGKNVLMFLVLSISMIPIIAILPGVYAVAVQTGLYDSLTVVAMVLASWQIPISIWILQAFFDRIPVELDEAAQIDGCSHLGAFYRVILPTSKPGVAAVMVIVAIEAWNNWVVPATLTVGDSKRLVVVGLFHFVKDIGVDWGRFTAYTVMSSLPILLLFFVMQKQFIQGLIAGAQKG